MGSLSTTSGIRCLLISQQIVRSIVSIVEALQSALFVGLLRDEDLQRYDTFPFDESQRGDLRAEAMAGLELWEREAVARHFGRAKSLLVVGAAGAREMAGLAERGFRVEGVDFGGTVVERSNAALVSLGAAATISLAPRFELPFERGRFDGAVIARKFYSMIHHRERRVEFLTRLRTLLPADAPLLISYFIRSRNSVAFRLQTSLGNLLRRLCGRRANIEMGDHLDPETPLFHHHFTLEEIRAEFAAAGFALVHHSQSWFGHAVGLAGPPVEPTRLKVVTESAVERNPEKQSGARTQPS